MHSPPTHIIISQGSRPSHITQKFDCLEGNYLLEFQGSTQALQWEAKEEEFYLTECEQRIWDSQMLCLMNSQMLRLNEIGPIPTFPSIFLKEKRPTISPG